MRGFLIGLTVLLLVVVGGGLIATAAYQVGVATAITTVQPPTDGSIVVPVVPPVGWGWGWGAGPGFGFFGFLGFLLFLFLLIGLIRAIAGPRRGWGGPGGYGGPGGNGGPGGWERRAHDHFDEWHRASHRSDPPDPAA